MRRFIAIGIAAAIAGCVDLPPPKPTIWQIEGECSDGRALESIPTCMRASLDFNYGPAWHNAAQVELFLNFIALANEEVTAGRATEAQARFAISQVAQQMQENWQAQQATNAAQLQAALQQAGLALLQQASPPPPSSPVVTCRSTSNPFTGVTTTCQ